MILLGDYAPGEHPVNMEQFSDVTILVNLEGPVIPLGNNYFPLTKAGPTLGHKFLPDGARVKKPKRIIYSVANNHSMDYGWSALEQTLHLIHERNEFALGAGDTRQQARKPLIIEENHKRIGILACCERQFGIAEYDLPGCAAMGDWLYPAIAELKRDVDYVIVSCHAAVENSPWPSPFLRDFYRSLADCGADIIHGHHAHVPQPVEFYKKSIIAYGLGNFVVPHADWGTTPNALWSIGLKIEFCDGKMQHEKVYIENIYDKASSTLIPAVSSDERKYAQYEDDINHVMHDDSVFLSVWHEVALLCYDIYCEKYLFQDINTSMKENIFKKILDNLSSRNTKNYRDLMLSYVMVACESHRGIIETAMAILTKVTKNLQSAYSKQIVRKYMGYLYDRI